MSTERARRLGRGLEALLSSRPAAGQRIGLHADEPPTALRNLPVGDIRANPLQPRRTFAEEDLAELEASIRGSGLLQPVVVRSTAAGFELVAGERRLRAVQRLGWKEIPAIVREIEDREMLTLALIENLQRADLNPIEEAEGYQQLVDQFSLTQQEVAQVVGKDRATVANMLRLLGLPVPVRRLVRDGELSVGHARALLALGDDARMTDLAKATIAGGWNVREVERRVRESGGRRAKKRADAPASRRPAEVGHVEEALRRHLQTDVRISLAGKDRGEVRISFYSADDLERLLDAVLGPERER